MDLLLYLRAFIVGGLLCVIAQVLLDKTNLTPARILVGYVVVGVILGALGLYSRIINFAGSGGATILTGFGNVIAEGVKKAVDEKGFLGVFTGGLSAASAGITAALVFGFIASILFRSKKK